MYISFHFFTFQANLTFFREIYALEIDFFVHISPSPIVSYFERKQDNEDKIGFI